VAGGDKSSLRAICIEAGMPDRATFNGWRKLTPELEKQYAQAREDQKDTFFEELVEIADTEPDPQKARNRMDARKWVWARMDPKRFGDRTIHAGDADAPISLVLNGSDIQG
jgi:hypothetical protein